MAASRSSWSRFCRLLASFFVMFTLMSSLVPAGALAASQDPSCVHSFFGLEPWYAYLDVHKNSTTNHCEVTAPSGTSVLGKNSFILLIVLAVVDDLLRVAGMVAIIFVIIAGFQFITSSGEPEAAAKARQTILYAVIGLVIALVATVIVSFIGNALG